MLFASVMSQANQICCNPTACSVACQLSDELQTLCSDWHADVIHVGGHVSEQAWCPSCQTADMMQVDGTSGAVAGQLQNCCVRHTC